MLERGIIYGRKEGERGEGSIFQMYLSLLLLYMYIYKYIYYDNNDLINLFKSIFLFLSKCHNVTNLFTYFSLWAGER